MPKPAKALLLVACVTAIGMPDCSVSMPVSVQSFDQRAEDALWAGAPVGADRDVPDRRRDEDVRDVAGRVVAFELAVEAVGDRVVRNRPGQNRRVEHRRGIVYQLRARVAHQIRQAARQPLLELGVDALIERRADVVPVQADGRVLADTA